MFVKPAKTGLIIRDPESHEPIPEKGREVPDTTFWRRRIKDGDVVSAGPEKRVASVPEKRVEPVAAEPKTVKGEAK